MPRKCAGWSLLPRTQRKVRQPWGEIGGGNRGDPGGSQARNNRETLAQALYTSSTNTEVVFQLPYMHTQTNTHACKQIHAHTQILNKGEFRLL